MDPIQITIIVIVMVVGAVRWIIENVIQKGSSSDEDAGDTLEDLYEEARREIQHRQARMLPDADAPRQARPPLPTQLPPPRAARPPEIPATPARQAPPLPPAESFKAPKVQKPTLNSAEQAALARLQEREGKARPKSRSSHPQSSIRDLLASPQAARKAILLHEILGAPKSARE